MVAVGPAQHCRIRWQSLPYLHPLSVLHRYQIPDVDVGLAVAQVLLGHLLCLVGILRCLEVRVLTLGKLNLVDLKLRQAGVVLEVLHSHEVSPPLREEQLLVDVLLGGNGGILHILNRSRAALSS